MTENPAFLALLDGTWFALGFMALVGLLILGAVIVGVIFAVLAARRSSRPPGQRGSSTAAWILAILGLGAAVVVVAGAVFASYFTVRRNEPHGVEVQARISAQKYTEDRTRRERVTAERPVREVSLRGDVARQTVLESTAEMDHAERAVQHAERRRSPTGRQSTESTTAVNSTSVFDTQAPWRMAVDDPLPQWRKLEAFLDSDLVTSTSPPPGEGSWVGQDLTEPFVFEAGEVKVRGLRPTDGNRVAGYSTSWEAVAEQDAAEVGVAAARQQARRSLVEQLGAYYLWKLAEEAQRGDRIDLAALTHRDLGEQIEMELRRRLDSLVVDSYEQEVVQNFGRFYRAAVLAEVSPSQTDDVVSAIIDRVHELHREDFRRDRRDLWTALTAAALGLVVFLLYLFLNAGTKGYFAWPLRLLALGALLATFAGLFYLRSMLG